MDVKQFWPEATRSGPRLYYRGYTSDQYGVLAALEFTYSECAYDVSIWQSESFGYKAKRVRTKLNACLAQRAQGQPFKPNDYAFCGSLDALMDREP